MKHGLFGVRGKLTPNRAVAWSSRHALIDPLNDPLNDEAVYLNNLKAVINRKVPGATVNDAVLASIASALGDMVKASSVAGEPTPVFLTAVVPVNLRPLLAVLTGNIPNVNSPLSEQIKLLQGNKIGGLLFDLPLNADDSANELPAEKMLAMVKETKNRTAWCKLLPESLLAYLVAVTSSSFSIANQKAMQFHAIGQSDLAVSNVRGPDDTVHVCGLPVEQLVGFLPPPNGCPLGIAVTSYKGVLQLSVNVDENALQTLMKKSDYSKRDDVGNVAQFLLTNVEKKLHMISK